jgi:fructose-specific component phosphotransferase system IIB-like protein
MISLCSSDLEELIKHLDEAKMKAAAQQISFEHMEVLLKEEISVLCQSTKSQDVDIQGVQNYLEGASIAVQELELQWNTLVVDCDMNLAQLQAHCDEFVICVTRKRDELESKCREHDRALLRLESVQSTMRELEEKWDLDISSGVADLAPPDVCPTCQQPISDSGKGLSHEDLQRIIREEVNDLLHDLVAAQDAMWEATDARDSVAAEFDLKEK